MKRSLSQWRDMEPNYAVSKVSRLSIKKMLEDAKRDIIELHEKLENAYTIEPMDTAPRDATEVDLFLVGGKRVMNASWEPSDGFWTGGYSDEDCLAWMKSPVVKD